MSCPIVLLYYVVIIGLYVSCMRCNDTGGQQPKMPNYLTICFLRSGLVFNSVQLGRVFFIVSLMHKLGSQLKRLPVLYVLNQREYVTLHLPQCICVVHNCTWLK